MMTSPSDTPRPARPPNPAILLPSLLATLLLTLLIGNSCRSQPTGVTYLLQSEGLGHRHEALAQLRQAGRAIIILDEYAGDGKPWTAQELASLRQSGTRVLAYLSIGEAENYRAYWRRGDWSRFAPPFLAAENPDWPGNYAVHYQHEDWIRLMEQEAARRITQGFDGLYLDLVDAHLQREDDGENPQLCRQQMATLVQRVAAAARAIHPQAFIAQQNGVAMILEGHFPPGMLQALAVESLYRQPSGLPDPVRKSLCLQALALARKQGAAVWAVEYCPDPLVRQAIHSEATLDGICLLYTNRDLKSIGTPAGAPWQRASLPRH